MAEKRKARGGRTISRNDRGGGGEKKRKTVGGSKKNPKNREGRKGPRIPNSLRKEVDSVNPRNRGSDNDSDDDEIDLQDIDVYEYAEAMAEEESKKNKRYDAVENYQYELPEEFEDENVSSDDDDDNVDHASGSKRSYSSDESEDDEDEDNDGRHAKMLQEITGMPAEAFEGKKKTFDVISEAYPESEYNPTQNAGGDGPITVDDLLNPLQKKRGYVDLRKRISKLESSSLSVQTPISKLMRENVERKVAYEVSKEEITKWEPLVKRNREASTIFFDADTNVGFSTVGAIASDFKPRTAFEKKMDSLVHDPKIVEAHKEDGARLLELNKISIKDVKERQNRLAKMRDHLFWHETRAKRVKKIKSKTYHRLLKKNKLKAANAEIQTDPEAAKEEAIKQEFKRAEERLRLKHKNKNKWAERVLKLGLAARDEGTRVALIEQLHEHAVLTRKMDTMKESSSSSDEDSDEDDDEDDFELSPGREQDVSAKLLNKAKEKTIKVMEADNEMPSSGVLSLPFMVRGMKKREEEALKEAEHAVKEYELSLKKLDDSSEGESPKAGILSGRRVFGAAKKQSQDSGSMIKTNRRDRDRDTDSEDDYEAKDHADPEHPKDLVHVNANMVYEGSDTDLQSIDDIIRDSGHKTTHEVAMFAPNSNKKTGNKNKNNRDGGSLVAVEEPTLREQDVKDVNNDEDTESEEEVEDYKFPSQEELIRRAFAGDDVEEEFEKDKQEVLNEENPEPEKPVLVPGWGQWTHVQKKKGMPSWMLAEHEVAKKKREESIKQRKDAHLKHVVISEKVNKKADKLHATTLPFPFTSKEAYEQSIRVPIGPEYNPATVVGDLIRPEVVKKSGVIIKPIKFEDVDPHERGDGEQKSKAQSQKGNNKSRSGKGNKSKKIKSKN